MILHCMSNPDHDTPRSSRFLLMGPVILAASLLLPGPVNASTERVSVASNGAQANSPSSAFSIPAISADGRFVAFDSHAFNLTPGDTNLTWDTFVHDRVTGITERATVSTSGAGAERGSEGTALSPDGRFVAFSSVAGNLVPNDTNQVGDTFIRDRELGITERVSVSSSGEEGNQFSAGPEVSADGRFVVFTSSANNLVLDDTNETGDVFIRDREMGTTERVSISSSGAEGNGYSAGSALSADGRFVAFSSIADNLVPNDTNENWDIFVHDRETGITERVSVSSSGAEFNGLSGGYALSADGRLVAFAAGMDNLAPGYMKPVMDIYVRDRKTGITECVSVSSTGEQANEYSVSPTISADGRFVAFLSYANNLVPGDANGAGDVFVHDRETGATELVSLSRGGVQVNDHTRSPVISADGRVVAFVSSADDFVPGDTNRVEDVFVRDRASSRASYRSLASLPDIDDNAAPELAALRNGPVRDDAGAVIRDSLSKAPLGALPVDPDGAAPIAVAAFANSGGAPALALLLGQPNGGGVVRIKDAVRGGLLGTVPFFEPTWRMLAVAALANTDAGDLAVLAEKTDGTQAAIQIKSSVTQAQRRRIALPLSVDERYLGIASLPSLDGDGSPELATLRRVRNGTARVGIMKISTGLTVRSIAFHSPGDSPLAVAGVVSPGGAPGVAVLWRQPNGRGLVQVRNALTGAWVRQLTFGGADWEAAAVTALDIDRDGVSEIAVLVRNPSEARAAIHIKEAETKRQVSWIGLPME